MKNLINQWRGDFGNDYSNRNLTTLELLEARQNLWLNNIISSIGTMPSSILEVGAGNGQNIVALNNILKLIQSKIPNTKCNFQALEPNKQAREIITKEAPYCGVLDGDILNLPYKNNSFELVFTSGVLIHIHPDNLDKAIKEIYRVSSKYIVCIEYFSPNLEEIKYRDKEGMLWKQDFGSLYCDTFKLGVLNYGFQWKRLTGLDNLTWWLMMKAH